MVFLTALILDGGIAMNARERAADIAGQAARAAADDIDIAALQTAARPDRRRGHARSRARWSSQYAHSDSGGLDKVASAAMQVLRAAGGGHGHGAGADHDPAAAPGSSAGSPRSATQTAPSRVRDQAGVEC